MKVTMLGKSYAYASAPLAKPVNRINGSFYPYLHEELGAEPWELGITGVEDAIKKATEEAGKPGPVSDWPGFVLGLLNIGKDAALALAQQKQQTTTSSRDSELLTKIIDNLTAGRRADEGLTFTKAAPWVMGAGFAVIALIFLMSSRRRTVRR
jgi:hypothetical protein